MVALTAPAGAATRKVLVHGDRAWVAGTDGVVLHRMKLEVPVAPAVRVVRLNLRYATARRV